MVSFLPVVGKAFLGRGKAQWSGGWANSRVYWTQEGVEMMADSADKSNAPSQDEKPNTGLLTLNSGHRSKETY